MIASGDKTSELKAGQFTLKRLLGLVFTIALIVALGKWLAGQMGDAKPASERNLCQHNLTQIWHALEAHIEIHGDVPRNAEGDFSLLPLASLSIDTTHCPTSISRSRNDRAKGYRVAQEVTDSSFKIGATPVPIVFDVSTVHGRDTDLANVLFSDGHVAVWAGSASDYNEWIMSWQD